jgi:hypothetical protein
MTAIYARLFLWKKSRNMSTYFYFTNNSHRVLPPPPPPLAAAKQVVTRSGIFKRSMGARNRVGIGLSYRPSRLHIGWRNSFLGINFWDP